MEATKHTVIKLVRDFFNPTMQEMKALTSEDRCQLASAIARQQGIPEGDLGFVPVEY